MAREKKMSGSRLTPTTECERYRFGRMMRMLEMQIMQGIPEASKASEAFAELFGFLCWILIGSFQVMKLLAGTAKLSLLVSPNR